MSRILILLAVIKSSISTDQYYCKGLIITIILSNVGSTSKDQKIVRLLFFGGNSAQHTTCPSTVSTSQGMRPLDALVPFLGAPGTPQGL